MKKILALILAVATLFCIVGCGKEAEKTIVVGYTIYAPMNYKDDAGNLVGFDTELAKAVFEKMGYKVIFQEIVWASKYTDLNSDTIDCIWNGFTSNAKDDDDGIERSKKVDFSYNYMENRQVVVVKKDSGVASAADLKGKLAAGEGGSAGETYAKTFEEVTFKSFTQQTECLTEVKSGSVDFAVVDAQLAKSYCGKGDYEDLTIVEALSSDVEYYAIGFKKGSELTAQVNAQLEALAADGTLAKLGEKYGVANSVVTDYADQKK